MIKNKSGTFTIAVLAVLFIIGPSLHASGKSGKEKAFSDFKVFYRNLLTKHGIIGSSIAVVHENKVIHEDFFGLARLEEQKKVGKDTIYHWASITKTLCGIAIMQLRDRGLLSLDDPVVRYLPELKSVYNPYGDMKDITIRHLMTHSAGFRAPTWPWKSEPWHPHEPLHWEQLAAMFPYTEILFTPGSRFFMSNPGIVFLGRIIEVITCLLYTSPSPRDRTRSRMPSSA